MGILGRLSGVEVRFGELSLSIDFMVLDSSQMPSSNLAILGLDQLAVHHMVVDFDARVLRIGGCEGYVVRMLENFEYLQNFGWMLEVSVVSCSNWYFWRRDAKRPCSPCVRH